jgi:hypothetical protein
LLPHHYIQSSAVGPGTGPAKLIQIYYPQYKSADLLQKALQSITKKISSLGMSKVSDFFIENMLCELWRLGSKVKILNSCISNVERQDAFLSDLFQEEILKSSVSKHPDIYYVNPFTCKYQNLFRFIGKDLHMRPSDIDQNNSASINVICKIDYDMEHSNGKIEVKWSGDLVNKLKHLPSSWFI